MQRRTRSNRALFKLDPDWKPEPPELIKEPVAKSHQQIKAGPSLYNAPQQTPVPSNGIYEGVLSIIELTFNSGLFPSRFIVILDKDKEMMRFPFGKLEKSDTTKAGGAEREVAEEVGIEMICDQASYVGSISFSASCIFHIFTNKVPSSTSVTLGEEQEEWGSPTADEVDQFIKDGNLTYRHLRSWEFFKKKRGIATPAVS